MTAQLVYELRRDLGAIKIRFSPRQGPPRPSSHAPAGSRGSAGLKAAWNGGRGNKKGRRLIEKVEQPPSPASARREACRLYRWPPTRLPRTFEPLARGGCTSQPTDLHPRGIAIVPDLSSR
ncbi:hypothetical protein KM043_017266 [Ampulex compressa]|nr:hypothetical protein KM043_017266 [Ampulex compressa]